MQIIELLLICGLICLQIYVFRNILKKNHLISTILPRKDSVRISKVFIKKHFEEEDVRVDTKNAIDNLPDATSKILYFSTMFKLDGLDEYYFKESEGSTNGVGFIKLEIDKSSVCFSPNCNVRRIKMVSNISYFRHLFLVDSTKNLNDADNVICSRRGECTAIPGGWKVIKKARIEY